MVASWTLLLLDLLVLPVYLDLWFVNTFKKHVYTPLLPLIPKDMLKYIKKNYYASLNRNYFCVSDKVDVSGTTFNNVFAFVYIINMLSNLFYCEKIGSYHFHSIAIPYFIFMMFCLTSYRGMRELCFYCKYPMIQNPIVMLIMIVFYLESFPKWYFVCTTFIFLVAVILRGVHNKEQKAKAL